MNTIKLFNRHGYSVTLNQIEGNDYLIGGDKDAFYYFRVIYNNDKTVKAIDPSGGPFISVGYQVDDDRVIDKITFCKDKGYIATLKDKINETD